jgi:hypothetical protein
VSYDIESRLYFLEGKCFLKYNVFFLIQVLHLKLSYLYVEHCGLNAVFVYILLISLCIFQQLAAGGGGGGDAATLCTEYPFLQL